MHLASVILPIPVDKPFTYRIPAEFEDQTRVGCRVLVPFGKRNQTGMVIGPAEDVSNEIELKDILDVLDEEPSFDDEMLRLTRWIADYYVCGWGEAIRAALPSGIDIESTRIISRTEKPVPAGVTTNPTVRAVLQHLEVHQEASLAGIRQHIKNVSLSHLRRLEREGLVEMRVELKRPKVRRKLVKHVRFVPAFQGAGSAGDLKAQLKGKKQVAIIEALDELGREGDPEPAQITLLMRAGASTSTLNSLVARNIVEIYEREVIRSPLGDMGKRNHVAVPHEFHWSQREALDRIHNAIEARRFETFLLHGVTGSGKTEVYISALKKVLAEGRTGIILVPEIALTPQTVRRFRAHFGDRIAVLHSRMSLGERYDAWRNLRNGHFSVVIGPRSAVMAPLSNIGLIVVDEEHEGSYKQLDPAPRYHARDVAVMRASMNGAVCVLGSATPSIESYMNAQTGKYSLLSMPNRIPVPGHEAAPLPDIRIIDLILERKKHRLDGAFSETLREAIGQRLERKEQIILLQNRRGYAPVIECQSCGWTPFCKDCSVTLTYHKARQQLRCHYCGLTQRVPRKCPSCGEEEFELLGTGTQRVEEELSTRFPAARVVRMDLDTTSRKDAHHKLLDQFGRGDADILIGTQMVAKGLDFGRVTLVGVINADAGMLLPDFRSEERTFQLLTQVAGRAGRAGLRGEVFLQTRNPKHPVIRFAAAHDYQGFVEAALPERNQFEYPPFGRIVGVEFRGHRKNAVEEMAQQWTDLLIELSSGSFLRILGPEAAFVSRVKRLYRYHTIIKAPRNARFGEIQQLLRMTLQGFGTPPKGCRIAVDVDAIGLF